jgi:prophage maintenance system killer protein
MELSMNKISKRLRQEKILNLFQDNEFVTISFILSTFQKEEILVSRITIVRDLEYFLKEGTINKKLKGKYSLSPRYKLFKIFDVEYYFAKEIEKRGGKKNFDFDIFGLLEDDIFTNNEMKVLESYHNDFQKNFKKFTSLISIQKEFERIVIEFSWKSSVIEGNTYSLLETERLIRESKETVGKTKQEAQMILNHKKAFDFVLQYKSEYKKNSLKSIEEIHSILVEHLNVPKNIRNTPVGIVGSDYKPLDNKFQINDAIEKMLHLIDKKESFFEQSFLLLLLLSYIQAFEDGNKRTARMMSNSILLANDSCPLSYRTVDELEYKKATLLFYEQGSIAMLKEVFIQQYKFAVENYF